MSITAYEYLSILQTAESNGDAKTHDFDYLSLLEKIRATIAERHSKELAAALDSRDAAKTLKALILQYCVEFLAGTGFEQEPLVEKIYLDMVLALIFAAPLIFKILMPMAYEILVTSLVGQGLFVLLLAAVVFSLVRALKLNKPILM